MVMVMLPPGPRHTMILLARCRHSAVTLFLKWHSQLSNWWHAPTRSLSLVDTILACLLLADTVVCCQSVSQLSHQPRPVHCTCSVAFCSWEQQAQICPHISYRKLKVCALFVWFEFKKLTVKSVAEISRQY